jgi:hypothetical protein
VALGESSGRREKWRGKRREARREEARAALELGATRGGEGQQQVARGDRKWQAAVLQQRSIGAEQGCQRKKKERRGSKGLVCKNREVQGPHCKLKFPTDLKA